LSLSWNSVIPGLNLSWEVLEGIVKHETAYDISDARDFNPDLRGHLEAQICNAADELAYTAHDLDDGLRSGLIHSGMLEGIEIWEILVHNVDWDGSNMNDLTRHMIIRELIGMNVTDVIHAAEDRLHSSNVRSAEEVQKLSYNVVTMSEDHVRRNRQLKDFLYKNLYRNYRVLRMQMKAEKTITDLFQAYIANPSILPPHILARADNRKQERVICDYIAGMTDRYASEEHMKLFDPNVLP
jgi:dGTPase